MNSDPRSAPEEMLRHWGQKVREAEVRYRENATPENLESWHDVLEIFASLVLRGRMPSPEQAKQANSSGTTP